MRRKIIQLGTNTHVITLPTSFLRRWKLKKGDEVFVENGDNRLIIRIDSEDSNPSMTIGHSECSTSYLEELYSIGYDEVIVPDATIPDIPQQRYFEISEISGGSVILKKIGSVGSCTLRYHLQKIRFMLDQIGTPGMLDMIRHHMLICFRILAKKGMPNRCDLMMAYRHLHDLQDMITNGAGDNGLIRKIIELSTG